MNRSRRHFRRSPRRGRKPAMDFSTESVCPSCAKPESLCVCAELSGAGLENLENRLGVVILQHPQEPDKLLGTARVATRVLSNSKLHVGLSVANLKKLLGREDADPKRWAVLYLGSGIKAERRDRPETIAAPERGKTPGAYFVSKDGELLSEIEQKEARRNLEGILLLDGTWSQAKALWWRNPWLLKLRRIVLVPSRASAYKALRKEPRRECLSTIETAAETLQFLGEDSRIADALRTAFDRLLGKYREAIASKPKKSGVPEAPSQEEPDAD